MATCIYCPNDPNGKEHWLPRSLGRFVGSEPLLGRLCQPCNEKLGQLLDEPFAHNSPEAVFRERLGIRGRKHHRKVNPFYHRSNDQQAVKIVVTPKTGYAFLVELTEGDPPARPLHQLILRDGNGRLHHFPVQPLTETRALKKQIRQIKKQIRDLGLVAAKLVAVYCKSGELLTYRKLCTAIVGKFEADFFSLDDSNMERSNSPGRSEVTILVVYTQAIAKIAFHYMLKMLPHIDGHAPEFDALRHFIWNGGKWTDFVQFPSRQFVYQLATGMRPKLWGHYLVVEALRANIRETVDPLEFSVQGGEAKAA